MTMKIDRFRRSLGDALRGLRYVFKTEQNFRVQVLASILVLAAAIYFPLHSWEIILVVLLVMLVLMMELLNTALEHFSDLLKPRLNHYVYLVKDIMAGAVLLVALGAAIIGLVIFVPHFINFFK